MAASKVTESWSSDVGVVMMKGFPQIRLLSCFYLDMLDSISAAIQKLDPIT
jgi:hypothetical protein